jgi:hypothetical protein
VWWIAAGLAILALGLWGCGEAAPSSTIQPTASEFSQVDRVIENALQGNMAYNTPTSMALDETQTIQLLVSPSLSVEELEKQIQATATGSQTAGAQIKISPRMRAELEVGDPDAFVIQPLHDNPEQLVGTQEPTEWKWLIQARKEGRHVLTLTVYRLVEYQGKEYWRAKSYQRDIYVNVTLPALISRFDWKWLLGLIFPAVLVPLFWRWIDQRNKAGKAKGSRKNPKKVI